MADIFGFNDAEFGGLFSADEAKFTIDGIGDGMLIQNFQIQYQQQFQPIYEFGSSRVWYSRTHAAGQLSIGRIVSNDPIIERFAGMGCNATTATVEMANGLCAGGSLNRNVGGSSRTTATRTLKLKGVFLTGVQWSGQAGQAYVSEGLTLTFVSAEM